MLLGEARVHTEDFSGKQRSFVAARSGANLQNHVLLVVGIFGQQQHLDLFFKLRLARRQCGDLCFGHFLHVGVGQHRARLGQPLPHLLQLAELLHRRLELAQRPSGLLVLFVVGYHLGKPHLSGKLVVTLLHLFQTIDHGKLQPLKRRQTSDSGFVREKRRRTSLAAGAAREVPGWAGGEPLRCFYSIAKRRPYIKGLTISTPSNTWPCCRSSVNTTRHPLLLAQ